MEACFFHARKLVSSIPSGRWISILKLFAQHFLFFNLEDKLQSLSSQQMQPTEDREA